MKSEEGENEERYHKVEDVQAIARRQRHEIGIRDELLSIGGYQRLKGYT